MRDRHGARARPAGVPICFGVSAALLAVCSRSSPFYPINHWVDANCFFTVGKAMMNGLVPYRDLYEQKGPLLYFLHGLAYLIEKDGFLGVYLLEVLALSCFLLSVLRILGLYAARVPCLPAAALGAAVVTSAGFGLGDSAEELCLPLVSWSLYHMLKVFREAKSDGKSELAFPAAVLHGMLAGCVLWMKYTMLGFHLGWILTLCLWTLRERGAARACTTGLAFALGMLLATLPWLAYFGAHRALDDLWTAYFYNNLFLYAIPSPSLTAWFMRGAEALLAGLRRNPGFALPVLAGLLWTLLCPEKYLSGPARAGVCATFLLLAAGVYGGGRAYDYYILIFSVYAVLGLLPVLALLEKAAGRAKRPPRAVRAAISAAGLALCLVLSYRYANDTYLFGAERTAAVQYRFAEQMRRLDNTPTLLNYGFLDGGFYTAARIVPTCKYFCILNIPLEEMYAAQDGCLRAGEAEFAVTRDRTLDTALFRRYELLAQDEFYGTRYYLYRRSA